MNKPISIYVQIQKSKIYVQFFNYQKVVYCFELPKDDVLLKRPKIEVQI